MAVKSSFENMTRCLFAICLVCSGLLAGVYVLTEGPIEEAKAKKEIAANKEVLPLNVAEIGPKDTINVDGVDYYYYLAFDENGTTIACAVNVKTLGFGGDIEMKVGVEVDPLNREHMTICNAKVLSHAETPGLGAKCTEPSFADQFKGFDLSEKNLALKKDKGDIDAITASTITSRAYVTGIAKAKNVVSAILKTSDTDAEDNKEVLPSNVAETGPKTTINVGGIDYDYYLAFDEKGTTVACAVNVKARGYEDYIDMMVGIEVDPLNPEHMIICNTKVLSQSETPGLGDQCTDASFSDQFKGFDPSEKKLALKKDGGDVDAISGATITSCAYVEGLEKALEVVSAILNTPAQLDTNSGASK